MSVFHNNALIGAGAGTGEVAAAEYVIPKSLRFNSGDSSYLSKTPSSAGNRRTWTWSGWVKRAKLGDDEAIFSGGASNPITTIRFSGEGSASPDGINIFHYAGSFSFQLTTTAQYRDLSSWYHIVVALDTTQATASNRLKLYVNGEQVTAFDTETYPSQNFETEISNTSTQTIARNGTGSNYKNGYLADIQFVDGQALAPTDFGETRSSDGVWVPKEYTFGTNPNNGTTWSTGASVGQGTFLEPGSKAFNGNLSDSAAPYDTAGGGGTNPSLTLDFSSFGGIPYTSSVRVYRSNGQASNHTISINGGTAVNHPQNQWFTVATGSGTLNSLTSVNNNSTNTTGIAAVEVDGYVLLDDARDNSFHLNFSDSSTNEALGFDSAPTIPALDPKKGFDVVTYTGNGASTPGGSGSTQNVGGLGFEPGLLWIKDRTQSGHNHNLIDVINQPPNLLMSDSTAALTTNSTDGVTSFNPDGFTLGANSSGTQSLEMNKSGNSYVAWAWKANGPAVSNSDGTTTSQVSVNTDYGFSIVTYTGGTSDATIGHGLGQTPKFYIVKATESTAYTDFWSVYHTSLGESAYIKLNENAAASTGSTIWNSTAPTTALFSVDATSIANENNTDYVAYVWSEVSGYSKFGTYEGASTVTVTTGFKPRWILLKNVDSSGSWSIFDSERDSDLEINHRIYANEDSAEGTNTVIGNFTDTGFTLTNQGNSNWNTTGDTFVYAAFADRPGNNWDVNNIVTNEGLTTSKTQFDVVTYTGNGGTQKIGGVKYSAFATGTTYSNQPLTNAFDGSTSTYAGAQDSTLTWTPSPAITVSSSLRIFQASNGSGGTFTVNGTSYASSLTEPGGWLTITGVSTLTSVVWSGSGYNQALVAAIEVDGTILIDGDDGPGLKFQPDLIWVKARGSAFAHVLQDSVRGFGSTKLLSSSSTAEENRLTDPTDGAERGYISGASSTGFTIVDGTGTSQVNGNNETYVAWCWKAGGTAVSNTDGSITSSVSANAEYGFSVVTWTGTATAGTIGHGLNGKVPKLIITKRRDSSGDWYSQHASLGATYRIQLNSTSAATSGTSLWNSTSPTGSVFSVGADNEVNASSGTFVAYCFANVPGYQRIGSYTGNGSTTGPVVVTGFKPRFLLIKNTSLAGSNWFIFDSKRSPSNPVKLNLKPNSSAVEETDSSGTVDFDQNGFQIKSAGTHPNGSGNTIIYLAIGDDEIGSDEDCLVDVPNAVTADADATDTTGGYQRGNYATLNPLDKNASVTLANGNLDYDKTGTAGYGVVKSTIAVSSGKWYCEYTLTGNETSKGQTVGVTFASHTVGNSDYLQSVAGGFGYYSLNGNIYTSTGNSSYGNTFDVGDTIGIALDMDNGKLFFSKNGVFQNSGNPASGTNPAASGLSGDYVFGVHGGTTDTTGPAGSYNFGQMRFKYPMPSGYAALNTTALPAATIPDGSAQFDTKLYTGTGSTQQISGLEFSPDFVWLKKRSGSTSHQLSDTVRGATKFLRSNTYGAEVTDANTLSSFNSDGFTVGSDAATNGSSDTFVSWNWNAGANSNRTYTVKVVSDSGNKYRFDDFGASAVTLDLAEGSTYIFDQSDSSNAGHPIRFGTSANGTDYTTGVTHTGTPGSAGAKTTLVLGTGVSTLYYSCLNHTGMGGQINTNSTAGSSNFDGATQSTTKANPEAGFSIVSWTGTGSLTTVGHSLNAVPEFMAVKNRNSSGNTNWCVYHVGLTSAAYTLGFDSSYFEDPNDPTWGSTAPTSSVFTVKTRGSANESGKNLIGYMFTPVAGFSAFGKYTGNGSTDGPFVYTGFRSRFILIKCISTSESWVLHDTARDVANVSDTELLVNSTGAEYTYTRLDVLSNGFKARTTEAASNTSGSTYVYAAFAENPFQANGGLAR